MTLVRINNKNIARVVALAQANDMPVGTQVNVLLDAILSPRTEGNGYKPVAPPKTRKVAALAGVKGIREDQVYEFPKEAFDGAWYGTQWTVKQRAGQLWALQSAEGETRCVAPFVLLSATRVA